MRQVTSPKLLRTLPLMAPQGSARCSPSCSSRKALRHAYPRPQAEGCAPSARLRVSGRREEERADQPPKLPGTNSLGAHTRAVTSCSTAAALPPVSPAAGDAALARGRPPGPARSDLARLPGAGFAAGAMRDLGRGLASNWRGKACRDETQRSRHGTNLRAMRACLRREHSQATSHLSPFVSEASREGTRAQGRAQRLV